MSKDQETKENLDQYYKDVYKRPRETSKHEKDLFKIREISEELKHEHE